MGCTKTKQVAAAYCLHALGAAPSWEGKEKVRPLALKRLEKHSKVARRWTVSWNTQNLSSEIPVFLEKNERFSPRKAQLGNWAPPAGLQMLWLLWLGLMGLLLCSGSFTSFCMLPFRKVNAVLHAKQHCLLWQIGSWFWCLTGVGMDSPY